MPIASLSLETVTQQRVSELLAKRKGNDLSLQEEMELERHLTVEHLVRLAKTSAYQKLERLPLVDIGHCPS